MLDTLDFLIESSNAIQSSGNAFVLSTFMLNFALSTSMNLLWSMLNTLQVIVHLPLVHIAMPQNVYALSKIIASIACFDIVPTELLYNEMFSFNPQAKSSGMRYELVGMETNNFLMNAGTLLWLIIWWGLLVAVYSILKMLALGPRSAKIVEWLRNRVFF